MLIRTNATSKTNPVYVNKFTREETKLPKARGKRTGKIPDYAFRHLTKYIV